MKKYELTNESREVNGRTLYRIRALADFDCITKGSLGGWVESEDNLSQDGNAWVFDNALVCGSARVYGDALVCGEATVCGWARVGGNAQVTDRARVLHLAQVCGDAVIFGEAALFDHARVYDYARVGSNARVYGHAEVHGGACVLGAASIRERAKVQCDRDLLIVGPLGSRSGHTTFFRGSDGDIHVACGCFNGTIKQFADKVVETHGDSKYAKEYLAAVELAKIHMGADHE